MGIPVNGKNIFPSNIQGLPTWYQIRISGDGYVARRENQEILIAFNPATVNQDIQGLLPGEMCIYNADMRGMPMRDDITMYGVPVKKFIAAAGVKGQLREYLSNMVYVGVVAYLLGIELEAIDEALDHHFKGRRKLVDTNMNIINASYTWSQENLVKSDPYRVQRIDKTEGKIMMTGNSASALGAVFGGVSFVAWYPITPSTSVIDGMAEYLPKLRQDEDGKATYAIVQAEDELAAIGNGDWGWLGWRPLHDCHIRTRRFFDGRICGLVLFRRNPSRYLEYSTSWSQYRVAHPHLPRGHHIFLLFRAW